MSFLVDAIISFLPSLSKSAIARFVKPVLGTDISLTRLPLAFRIFIMPA